MAFAVAIVGGCERAPATGELASPEAPAPIPAPDPSAAPLPIAWPAIPAALQGCWRSDDSDMPPHEIQVTADAIAIPALPGAVPARTGRTERVSRVTPTSIDGRFSALEDGSLVTVATMIELASELNGAPAGSMILREGDAGSYLYVRC